MPNVDGVGAANELTRRWASTHERGTTVLSGVGLWVLLALVAGGAAGKVREELEEATGLPADESMAEARRVWEAAATSPDVCTALALWVRDFVVLEEDWTAAAPLEMVQKLTGDPDVDRVELDRWVEEVTGGELHRMPVTVRPDTLLVLASAITIRTRWTQPFIPRVEPFAKGPWAGMPALQLHRATRRIGCLRTVEGAVGPITLVRIEGTNDVDVHLVLGEADHEPGAVLRGAIDALWSSEPAGDDDVLPDSISSPGVVITEVDAVGPDDQLVVQTVGFEITASHDLLEHADDFGLLSAARDGGFPGISSTPLVVDIAGQNAMARFTHEGFVAAAVTAVGMRMSAALPRHRARRATLTFDRPFGFVAVHRPTRLVLIAGWIEEPTPPAG